MKSQNQHYTVDCHKCTLKGIQLDGQHVGDCPDCGAVLNTALDAKEYVADTSKNHWEIGTDWVEGLSTNDDGIIRTFDSVGDALLALPAVVKEYADNAEVVAVFIDKWERTDDVPYPTSDGDVVKHVYNRTPATPKEEINDPYSVFLFSKLVQEICPETYDLNEEYDISYARIVQRYNTFKESSFYGDDSINEYNAITQYLMEPHPSSAECMEKASKILINYKNHLESAKEEGIFLKKVTSDFLGDKTIGEAWNAHQDVTEQYYLGVEMVSNITASLNSIGRYVERNIDVDVD